MFSWFKSKNPKQEQATVEKYGGSFFERYFGEKKANGIDRAYKVLSQVTHENNQLAANAGVAMDSSSGSELKMRADMPQNMPESIAGWYASQGFIGYQMCAILSQHWLIRKACSMPAVDATRNGYELVSVDGTDVPSEILKAVKKYDKKFKLRQNCEQFISMGRIFGIRIAMFDIETENPQEFYENPFNLDGVPKGSYRGISQIDPYWCIPELADSDLTDPASQHFYEPTYWTINGRRYHRSHLFIYRADEVPDMLKPVYFYGGVPVTQQIMERVYGAERTASESLGLVTSKRTNVWLTNMSAFMANEEEGISNLNRWTQYRDNYGIKLGDKDYDQFQQFDTSLSDLDDVIMGQYQLVSAAANVPATKLLGTTPKGFNSSGEYEEKSYHEMLESIQEHSLTELVERHHQLVMKSYCDEVIETTVHWKPTDSPTSKELAELNKLKADTDMVFVQVGALDGEDVRFRLSTDPDSGYFDMGEREQDDGNEIEAIRAELGLNEDNPNEQDSAAE